MDVETALIVACPAADVVVADQRLRLDRAARAGVPAHFTVSYPFKADLVRSDHRKLIELFSSFHEFVLRGGRTGWFDHRVVFVEPDDPTIVLLMIQAVHEAFPAHPIYGGVFDAVVPHLTIGHDQPPEVLRAAEGVVIERLPFRQPVDHVELWSGPALTTAPAGSWRHVRDYSLAKPT